MGVEVAVCAFCNGREFVTPVGVNFEHNKLSRLSPQYTPRAYQDYVNEYGEGTNGGRWDPRRGTPSISPPARTSL